LRRLAEEAEAERQRLEAERIKQEEERKERERLAEERRKAEEIQRQQEMEAKRIEDERLREEARQKRIVDNSYAAAAAVPAAKYGAVGDSSVGKPRGWGVSPAESSAAPGMRTYGSKDNGNNKGMSNGYGAGYEQQQQNQDAEDENARPGFNSKYAGNSYGQKGHFGGYGKQGAKTEGAAVEEKGDIANSWETSLGADQSVIKQQQNRYVQNQKLGGAAPGYGGGAPGYDYKMSNGDGYNKGGKNMSNKSTGGYGGGNKGAGKTGGSGKNAGRKGTNGKGYGGGYNNEGVMAGGRGENENWRR